MCDICVTSQGAVITVLCVHYCRSKSVLVYHPATVVFHEVERKIVQIKRESKGGGGERLKDTNQTVSRNDFEIL